MSTTTYTLSNPLTGMTDYNSSSFLMKADATASSYVANTTSKLYFSADFNATLAGATFNVNSPIVLAISAKMKIKAEWKNGHFMSSEAVAKHESAAATAILQKTKSALTDLKAKMTAIDTAVTDLNNHADTVALYATLMEN